MNPPVQYTLLDLQQLPKTRSLNPCVQLYGPGPAGRRCKSCAHLLTIQFNRSYHKCRLRRLTHGPGSDHRANWPSCSRYQPLNPNNAQQEQTPCP